MWLGLFTALLAAAIAPSGDSPRSTTGQAAWAAEPTYRFAGRYAGEWVAEPLSLTPAGDPAEAVQAFQSQAGQLRGMLTLDLDCDGRLRGEARAQTSDDPRFAAIFSGSDSTMGMQAALDLVAQATLSGSLAAREAASEAALVEATLEGTLVSLEPVAEEAPPPEPAFFQRWYAASPASHWEIRAGAPGQLRGTWTGAADLAIPAGAQQPGLVLRTRGEWTATRTAVALCPWRGTATATGTFAGVQQYHETVEFRFWPTGDGHLTGSGTGVATVTGGPAGGCQYTGGGPFAVRVVGEQAGGRFRFRLEDGEQSQLVVTTTCPHGRFSAPQPALSTAFGPIEVPEVAGAQARLEAPQRPGPLQGTLEVTVEPAAGAAPP
ncbi:MAG TPA: hypothetical protein VFB73_02555 [Chloroflexota bacterium]|nr:hypothetical protein [Chloroflexota bacterium]HZU04827.1 hypothetical protein [Chloroflexota bacterium]